MIKAGYDGRLNMTDPESVTVYVASRLISEAYNANVTEGGFATAMRNRQRSKVKNFAERFPEAARLVKDRKSI